MKNITDYDMDDVLALIGMARRRSTLADILPAIGLIAVGAALGAGIGLAFAPASGTRLRRDLVEGVGGRLGQLRERMKREEKHTNSVGSHPS